jgi:hypothetical protein
MGEPRFRQVYCTDCKLVLAKYSIKYFTETDVNELVHIHFSSHIKEGHAIETRLVM